MAGLPALPAGCQGACDALQLGHWGTAPQGPREGRTPAAARARGPCGPPGTVWQLYRSARRPTGRAFCPLGRRAPASAPHLAFVAGASVPVLLDKRVDGGQGPGGLLGPHSTTLHAGIAWSDGKASPEALQPPHGCLHSLIAAVDPRGACRAPSVSCSSRRRGAGRPAAAAGAGVACRGPAPGPDPSIAAAGHAWRPPLTRCLAAHPPACRLAPLLPCRLPRRHGGQAVCRAQHLLPGRLPVVHLRVQVGRAHARPAVASSAARCRPLPTPPSPIPPTPPPCCAVPSCRSAATGLSDAERIERDVYLYRSYIELGTYDVRGAAVGMLPRLPPRLPVAVISHVAAMALCVVLWAAICCAPPASSPSCPAAGWSPAVACADHPTHSPPSPRSW